MLSWRGGGITYSRLRFSEWKPFRNSSSLVGFVDSRYNSRLILFGISFGAHLPTQFASKTAEGSQPPNNALWVRCSQKTFFALHRYASWFHFRWELENRIFMVTLPVWRAVVRSVSASGISITFAQDNRRQIKTCAKRQQKKNNHGTSTKKKKAFQFNFPSSFRKN